MNKEQFISLAGKIADGTATTSEQELFNKYYDAFQHQAWTVEEEEVIYGVKEKLWKRINAKIDDQLKPTTQERKIVPMWIRVAASLLILVTASWLVYFYTNNETSGSEMISLSTTDHVKQISLPDGTQLWLNTNTSLKYPEQFTGTTREIFVEGEAYLEVVPDKSKPFIVYSGNLRTEVVGTKFTVKSYANAEAEVIVSEGKVKVSDQSAATKTVELTANQKAVYTKSKELTQVAAEATEADQAWRSGKLIYEGVPLQDVIRDLEERYNVSITFDEKLNTCPVHANFRDMTAKDAVELIAISVKATAEQKGSAYTLKGGSCE